MGSDGAMIYRPVGVFSGRGSTLQDCIELAGISCSPPLVVVGQ